MAFPLVPILTQLARTLVPIVVKQIVKQAAKQGSKQVVKKTVQQTAKQTSKQMVKGSKNQVGGNSVNKTDSLQKEEMNPLADSLQKGIEENYRKNQRLIHDQNSQIGKYTNYTNTYGNMPKNNIFSR